MFRKHHKFMKSRLYPEKIGMCAEFWEKIVELFFFVTTINTVGYPEIIQGFIMNLNVEDRLVMSIFNWFFDDRLNRLSKNRFFRFSEIWFWFINHAKIEKLILNSITPLSRYHYKSQECKVQTDICTQGLFYLKFSFEQLSFEPFFEKVRIFVSIEP